MDKSNLLLLCSTTALGTPHSLWAGLFRVVVHNSGLLLEKKKGAEKTTDVLFSPIRRAIDLEFCFVIRQAHLSAALWVLELVTEIRNCMLWSSGSWGGKKRNLASFSPSCVDVSEKNTPQNKFHPLLIHRKLTVQKPTAFFPFELSIGPQRMDLHYFLWRMAPQRNLHLLLLGN